MKYVALLTFALLLSGCKDQTDTKNTSGYEEPSPVWDTLFNGKNLDNWTTKIKGQAAGEDSLNTFTVRNGIISVNYDEYDGFGNRFGHLFYKKPYAAYYLRLEYRFRDEQLHDGEAWAYKNSGVMFHSQPPESMLKDQNFPVCLEGQFLGGNGRSERPTMNLCTPGTNVRIADTLYTPHCINSDSPTFHDSQWIEAGFLVLSDSLIIHYVNGKEVLRYTKPQQGGGMADDASGEYRKANTPIKEGYIALQSESHPIDFRNIRILDLQPVYHNKSALKRITDSIITSGKTELIPD